MASRSRKFPGKIVIKQCHVVSERKNAGGQLRGIEVDTSQMLVSMEGILPQSWHQWEDQCPIISVGERNIVHQWHGTLLLVSVGEIVPQHCCLW